MPRKYNNDFKSMVVNLVVIEKHSTIKTAEQLDIPIPYKIQQKKT